MSRTTYRRTKIVATLGPSWDTPDGMRSLLDAGVDVVRINTSHGTPEIRERWIKDLKDVLKERAAEGPSAAILVDLQGPRIRVGRLDTPRLLTRDERVTFAPESTATVTGMSTTSNS